MKTQEQRKQEQIKGMDLLEILRVLEFNISEIDNPMLWGGAMTKEQYITHCKENVVMLSKEIIKRNK